MKSILSIVFRIFVLLLACQGYASAATAVAENMLLRDRRALVELPNYSPAERQLLADQVRFIVNDMYVNLFRKLDLYGAEADSRAELESITKDAASIPDLQLHQRLQGAVTKLHDFHLRYYLPKPLSCYKTMIPISFDVLNSNPPRILVHSIISDAGVLALVPEAKDILPGYELVQYNGLDPLAAIQNWVPLTSGSNAESRFRRALQLLSLQRNDLYFFPEQDSLPLVLKKPDGTLLSISLPWVTKADAKCLGAQFAGLDYRSDRTGLTELADEEEQNAFQQLFSRRTRGTAPKTEEQGRSPDPVDAAENPAPADFADLIATAEPTISYKILHQDGGDYAYLKISQYRLGKLDYEQAWRLIRGLLQKEFKSTLGLIIDVRGNPGGIIPYGETMVQFFTPGPVESLGFQMRVTEATRDYVVKSNFSDDYIASANQAMQTGAAFTQAYPVTTTYQNNFFGQVYFAPVIVLTDSTCFSTCDMFTASIQDHGSAKIIGVDLHTGGGGANNLDYVTAYAGVMPSGSVPTLPGSQGMSFAFRETLRIKQNAGVLLEDDGTISDEVIGLTQNDFANADADLASSLIFRLNIENQAKAFRALWLDKDSYDLEPGQDLALKLEATRIGKIQFRANGQTIQTIELEATAESAVVNAVIPKELLAQSVGETAANGIVEAIGYAKNSKNDWVVAARRVLRFRKLGPWQKPPFAMNATGNSIAPFMGYSWPVDSTTWANIDGAIGFSDNHYSPAALTDLSLFLDLTASSAGTKLEFDASIDSEAGNDYLILNVIDADGKPTTVLSPISGKKNLTHYSYDLSPYLGQRVELRFSFRASSAVQQGVGARIQALRVL